MPPPGANIVPALPLNHVPPSPRSEASGTTERSRDSERGGDRAMSRMSQTSLSPRVPIDVSNSRLFY